MSVVAEVENPALTAFVAQIAGEFLLAQVVIRRGGCGFELRHVADREIAERALRTVKPGELRALARFTETGEFRPLRCAPNLVSGWRAITADTSELGLALDQLYPGGVADWFAGRGEAPPITSFREFTDRQSGMYRIITRLDDAGAARVISACCEARCCLKRRRWSVAGLAPDAASEKSAIPCLEPCAVLLDLARKAVRQEQQEKKSD